MGPEPEPKHQQEPASEPEVEPEPEPGPEQEPAPESEVEPEPEPASEPEPEPQPEKQPTSASSPSGCVSASGKHQPECFEQSEQRCKRMMQYENKCQWNAVSLSAPTPPTPASSGCYPASGKN